MPGRLLHAVLHAVAAVLFVALAAGAAALAGLAVWRPPPYHEWVADSPFGALAALILLAGTGLWVLLAVAALIWASRCARRAVAGHQV